MSAPDEAPVISVQPSIDAGTAFSRLWKDPDGKSALAIGGLMYLLFPLIIPPLIARGWLIEWGRGLAEDRPSIPKWKLSQAGDGLKIWIVGFILQLPGFLIVVLFYIPFITAIAARPDDPRAAFGSMGILFLGASIATVWSLFVLALRPAVDAVFLETGRISESLRPRAISPGWKPFGAGYLLAPVLLYVGQIVAALGILACGIGLAFTAFYARAIQYELAAQVARQSSK